MKANKINMSITSYKTGSVLNVVESGTWIEETLIDFFITDGRTRDLSLDVSYLLWDTAILLTFLASWYDQLSFKLCKGDQILISTSNLS